MTEESAIYIAEYEIRETLQETFEGVIYRAVNRVSRRKVILKKYYPSLIWSSQLLQDFLARVDYLRFIEHDYLLAIVDLGQHEGIPYIVYEDDDLVLLAGFQARRIQESDGLQFLHMVAEALDFLHKQEIIHGTLTVENVALDGGHTPKIFDHGLTSICRKVLRENFDDGFQSLSIAQPMSMAPEQLLGGRPNQLSDIYSLGIVGYYFIFGEHPFRKQDVLEVLVSKANLDVRQTLRLPGTISPTIIRFIEKCIQVNPEDRFNDISEVLGILDRLISGQRGPFRLKKRFIIVKESSPKRGYRLYLVTVVLLFSIVASLYWLRSNQLSIAPVPTATSKASDLIPLQATSNLEIRAVATATERMPSSTSTAELTPVGLYQPAIQNQKPLLPNERIALTNLSNLVEISRLGYGKPEDLAASPDGRSLALATSAGVYIYEGTTLDSWIDPQGWTTSIQFSPDGETLAVGLASGEIQLWDWASRTKSFTLLGHKDKINRILFSKSKTDFYMYSASEDRNILIWDFKKGEQVDKILPHSRPVNDMVLNADERILISCSEDALIHVWDVASAKQLRQIPFDEKGNKAKALAITSDGLYFAAGGESGYIRQWKLIPLLSAPNPETALRISSIPAGKAIWSLQYIRDDTELLASLSNDAVAEVARYDPDRSGYQPFSIIPPAKYLKDIFGSSFNFSSAAIFDGSRIVSINWDGVVTSQQTELLNSQYDIVDRLDVSQDSTLVAAGGRRKTTKIWNLTTNQLIYSGLFELPYGHPISPDGSSVALLVPKTVIKSITTGNETPIYVYQMKQLSGSQGSRDLSEAVLNGLVSYARQGNVFVAANLNQSRAWDFISGYETYINDFKSNNGCRLTLSKNNGEVLQVFSSLGTFTEWNEPTASKLCQLTFQFGHSTSTFSNRLDLFVYVNSKNALEAYQIMEKQMLWQYPLMGNVTALSISPNQDLVAFGDSTGMLGLLDNSNGRVLNNIQGNFGAIRSIVFSEDGKFLVTSGDDGTTRVFGILSF